MSFIEEKLSVSSGRKTKWLFVTLSLQHFSLLPLYSKRLPGLSNDLFIFFSSKRQFNVRDEIRAMNFAKIGGLLQLLELLEHKTMKCVANYLHNPNSCRFVLRLRWRPATSPTCPLFVIILFLYHLPFYLFTQQIIYYVLQCNVG